MLDFLVFRSYFSTDSAPSVRATLISAGRQSPCANSSCYSHSGQGFALSFGEEQPVQEMMNKPLIYLFLICLLTFPSAFAQPQAPVDWGEARWFDIGNYYYFLHPAILCGDTLNFTGGLPDDDSASFHRPAVITSHDNGESFGNWYILV